MPAERHMARPRLCGAIAPWTAGGRFYDYRFGSLKKMERQFLIDEFKIEESWRLFKIMGEFVDGVEELHHIGPAVSIFGSARIARAMVSSCISPWDTLVASSLRTML